MPLNFNLKNQNESKIEKIRNRSNRKFKMKAQNSLVARQTLHNKSGLEKSRKEKIAEDHPISSFRKCLSSARKEPPYPQSR